jgi:AraC family transcriptional regulator of adaptative response / DNA-3-methyladenine glycosylase II
MKLDTRTCSRARLARDARFDGKFFIAVISTHIYCRPICPARASKESNVRYYATAAAAAEAGFRPCLRCRPDRVPDLGWIAAPELVCRAMHSIADGALDDATEDDLAAHLGVSARHLRRMFAEYVGATPSEVARSRRAHFARRLLDDTDLPMTQIATAACFNTVRQMNRVVQEIFQFTPSELRAKRRQPDRLVVDGGLELRLPYRAPLAWTELLEFLAPRAIPGVETVDLETNTYRRVADIDSAPGVIEVWDVPREQALHLRAHLPAIDGLVHLVAGVRRLFDLDADPKAIDRLLAKDDRLRPLVRVRKGLRVPGALDPFELGVRAILGQQVSVARATALSGALVEQLGKPVRGIAPLGLTHEFPKASVVARADLSTLGLTTARARALQGFAAAMAGGELTLDRGTGLEETVRALCALPGIGPWTANYVAMRACGERDAFPASDLALRQELGADPAAVAEAWRPWRAYAAMHIWASHSDLKRAA